MADIDIRIPKPYPAQQALLEQSKRFNLWVIARRWGKTTAISMLTKKRPLLQEGCRAAYSAPTWKLMLEAFEDHRDALEPATVRVNREDRRIELWNGSVIEFWSGQDTQSGRGRKYHIWVNDETQRQRWLKKFLIGSVRPTLADYKGELYVVGTANGEGSEFHEFYQECLVDPEWFVGTGKLEENPFIDPAEIAALRVALGPELAAQELDSQWVRVDGVAPLVRKIVWDNLFSVKEAEYRRKTIGVDASVNSDTTGVSAVWEDNGHFYTDFDDVLVFYPEKETGEINYAELSSQLYNRWLTGKYAQIAYDPYQLVAVMQGLKSAGVPCVEVNQNSGRLKTDSYLRQLINQGKFHHPNHDIMTQHFTNATLKYQGENVRIVKSTRDDKIDLAVTSALATWVHYDTKTGQNGTNLPAVSHNAGIFSPVNSPVNVPMNHGMTDRQFLRELLRVRR